MKVKDIASECGFKALALPAPDREADGVYIGDLLSWVMGRADADNVWITIMSNVNVIAVATLSDVSCVLLAEGVVPQDELIRLAEEKGINLLSTDKPIYEAAIAISEVIK